MAEDLTGAGVSGAFRILGSAGQLRAIFFGGDLCGDVIRHLVEGPKPTGVTDRRAVE